MPGAAVLAIDQWFRQLWEQTSEAMALSDPNGITIRDSVGIEIVGPAPRAEGLLTGLARPLSPAAREQSTLFERGG